MNLPTSDLLDRLASEYVLGTLRGGARRRFECWMQQHAALRERVLRWQQTLVPLAGVLPRESAPPHTWERLEQRLFGMPPAAGRRGWAARLAAHLAARLAGTWAAVASLALAIMGGLLWLAPERLVSPETLARRTQQVPASYMAVLSDAQGRPALVASAARHARRLELKVLRPSAPVPGTQWVLWALSDNGERFALGRIDLAARSRIELPRTAEQTLSKVVALAVSAEPAQALPAAPTRVALLQGPCVKVW